MGRQVQTAGVGMRKGFGGVQGEQRWETALAQPPPQGLGPPRLFGVVGESPPPPPQALRACVPHLPPGGHGCPRGTLLPPGDTATPGPGSSPTPTPPEHRGFPPATVSGAPPGMLRLGSGGETPMGGSPVGAGDGHTGRAADGGSPRAPRPRSGRVEPLRARPPSRTRAKRVAGAVPAELREPPPHPRRGGCSVPPPPTRGPLPPKSQPGLQPRKVWRHEAATGG